MYKSALIGAFIVTGLAFASAAPAQAKHAKFSIQISSGYHNPVINVPSKPFYKRHYKRQRIGVSKRQIRRTVRNYGCYNISKIRRINWRYKVKATCDYNERVKMVFSARSGRLISEQVIGYQPQYRQFSQFRQYRNWRH